MGHQFLERIESLIRVLSLEDHVFLHPLGLRLQMYEDRHLHVAAYHWGDAGYEVYVSAKSSSTV